MTKHAKLAGRPGWNPEARVWAHPGASAACLAVLLTLTGVTGCARGGGGRAGNAPGTTNDAAAVVDAPVKPEFRYKVTQNDGANFYRISPQQPSGPDEVVKKDTRITLLKRYGGFSQVQVPNFGVGYIATENIARLNPQEVAEEDAALQAKLAPPTALAPTDGTGADRNYIVPADASHDAVLPQAEPNATPKPAASPTPNPMFRY